VVAFQLNWKFQKSMKILVRRAVTLHSWMRLLLLLAFGKQKYGKPLGAPRRFNTYTIVRCTETQ
jgi:hypothetical protein